MNESFTVTVTGREGGKGVVVVRSADELWVAVKTVCVGRVVAAVERVRAGIEPLPPPSPDDEALVLNESKRVVHVLNEAVNPEAAKKVCPACGADYRHWHIEDYSLIWHDGKVVCSCGQFIRDYDAG